MRDTVDQGAAKVARCVTPSTVSHRNGDGVRLAVDIFGDPATPPVLFFHGGGQSRRSWRGTAERAGEAGYYALSLDLRGHGDSEWAPDGDYGLEAYARDVERLIESFDQPVALVGASRGGQAALIGGSRHPDRVSLIMLADVIPQMAQSGTMSIRAFFEASRQGFASPRDAADAISKHMGRAPITDLKGVARALRSDANGRLFWRWDPRTSAPEFIAPPTELELMTRAASTISRPVVLVRAGLSTFVTDEGVAAFKTSTPQLVVIDAPGVGHMFTGDRNDIFAERLLESLAAYVIRPT